MLEVPNADLNAPSDKCPGSIDPCIAEKERISSQYPGKLVIFYGSQDYYHYDNKGQKWVYGPTDNWSNAKNNFVAMIGNGGEMVSIWIRSLMK